MKVYRNELFDAYQTQMGQVIGAMLGIRVRRNQVARVDVKGGKRATDSKKESA